MLFRSLHDIGKIGIPDNVLLKPGKLDDTEWPIMQSHTLKGGAMVDTIEKDLKVGALNREDVLRNIVLLHHEALDGSGYPFGLEGEQVPLEARIVSVADIFDALTSARPYKEGWPVDKALEELDRLADAGKLDTRCVTALASQPASIAAVMERHKELAATG